MENPGSKSANESRIQSLQGLLGRTRTIDMRDDDAFQGVIVQARGLLELSDQEIADALLVSRPTVNRWINGKNLPHPAMRKPILSWVAEQLIKRIKRLTATDRLQNALVPATERVTAKLG